MATTLEQPRSRRSLQRAALVLAAVIGLLVPALPSSAEDPQTAAEAAALVASKGHELEKVTEQFLEAREKLRAQQVAAKKAAKALKKAQVELARNKKAVRGIARSAFTGGGLSTFSAMMTSDSAEDFVDRVGVLQMVAGHQNELLGKAATANVAAAQAEAAAAEAAGAAQQTYDEVVAQQKALEAQIAEYRALYDQLSEEERQAAIAAAERTEERASRDTSRESGGSGGAGAAGEPFSTSVAAGSKAAQVVVDTALAQRGKPYVWAAAGPNSYDCSGLVQYAFAAAGMNVPHSSAMQATMGRPVSRAQLQPGDLVAFYSPVSHIGIYIGNGQMVHAPTFGDVVKVSRLDAMGGDITAMRRLTA